MELVLPWIRNREGTLSAKGSMKMAAEKELDNETGRLLSDGDMDISVSVLSNKNGTASSGKNITIKGTCLDNEGGTLSARDGIILYADRSVNNIKGKIQSSRDISLSAAALDNREGKIVSGRNLAVKTKEDLLLQGKAAGGNNATFVTEGNLQNRTDVTAGNVLHLSGKTVGNAKDTSLSGKHISIEAGQVENRGLVQASDTVSIEAGTLDNIGTGKYTGIPSVFLPLPCITMWMRIKKRHWKSTGTSGNGETGHGKSLGRLSRRPRYKPSRKFSGSGSGGIRLSGEKRNFHGTAKSSLGHI